MTEENEDFIQTTDDFIRARMIHVLTIYPGISPSMLQVGIGTAIAPKMWHPIMADLKARGLVVEESQSYQAPNGRDLSYKKLTYRPPATIKEYTGTACGACGLPQFNTPSGVTCDEGHGGEPAEDIG